jgi:chemotaxis protein CheD
MREGIRVVSEDTGGEKGRKIVFNTGTNEVAVLKVDRLRKGDWYPYEGDR